VDEKLKKKSENQSVTARKRKKGKKNQLGHRLKSRQKLSLSNLMIIRKQIKTKKSLINDLFFFIVVFSVLSCSLPCNCYLSNFNGET